MFPERGLLEVRADKKSTISTKEERMIVVSGTIEIDPTDRVRALAAVAALTAATLAEPGCITYGIWTDPAEPGRFRVFEEWQNEAALTAHFGTPHIAAFRAQLATLKIRSSEIWRYEVTKRSRQM